MGPAFRNELKFLLSSAEDRQLQSVLHSLLAHDPHAGPEGIYHIRSLYLDDLYRTAYRQKMAGVEVRKKYRVRIYDCRNSHIALECKHKNGAYIYKETVPLSPGEYAALTAGDCGFLLRRPQAMARQFYVEARTRLIRPCVIVAYDREAFVNDVGTVRITFDRTLTAMEPGQDLFDPAAAGYHVLPPGQTILEVKFTGILPEYIQNIFRAYSYVRTSASKFCLCADQVRHILR